MTRCITSFPSILTGTEAEFNMVTGFAQITGNQTVVVDRSNHCLRSVHPRTGVTTPYAGHCTERGYADGQLLGEALFHLPYAIGSHGDRLYVTDTRNQALRLITEGRVSTIIKDSLAIRYPLGLTFTDGFAFITPHSQGLVRLDLLTKSVTILTNGTGLAGSLSAAQLSYPFGLTFLSPSVLLIADWGKHQLFLANITNNTITEICDGTRATTDGDIRSCQLNLPFSVLMVNQSVYVGQRGAIRRLPVAALSEFFPPTETTTATPGENTPIIF